MRWVQQLQADLTKCSPRGSNSFRQDNCAQIGHSHEAKICDKSGACAVNKNICLLRLLIIQEARRHWTHTLEIAVNNAELVKVGYTRHDLRELDVFY